MESSESEDDQDLLHVVVAGSAYSTSRVTEPPLMDQACDPTLQPPTMEGLESSNMKLKSSSLQVHDITDLTTEHACKSILQSETEDDQDLLDVIVAGSAYSTSRVTEPPLIEQACEPILQPPTMEGHESSNMKPGFSSLQVHGITGVHACKSILQPASMEGHAASEDMTSASQLQDITELPTEDACNSILQQPEVEGQKSTHNLMRRSPYFLGFEYHKPTYNFSRSSQVRAVSTKTSFY